MIRGLPLSRGEDAWKTAKIGFKFLILARLSGAVVNHDQVRVCAEPVHLLRAPVLTLVGLARYGDYPAAGSLQLPAVVPSRSSKILNSAHHSACPTRTTFLVRSAVMSVDRRSLAHPRLRKRAQACARERSLPCSAAGSTEGQTFCDEHAATFRARQRGHIGPKVPPCWAVGSRPPGRARSGRPAREPTGDGSGTMLAYPALPGLCRLSRPAEADITGGAFDRDGGGLQ